MSELIGENNSNLFGLHDPKFFIERPWHQDGFRLTLAARGPALDHCSVAKLANVSWKMKPAREGIIKDDSDFWDVRADFLLGLYSSLQEEMIRFGLIPRPLVEDEVKALRAELLDCRITRDKLLAMVATALPSVSISAAVNHQGEKA